MCIRRFHDYPEQDIDWQGFFLCMTQQKLHIKFDTEKNELPMYQSLVLTFNMTLNHATSISAAVQ